MFNLYVVFRNEPGSLAAFGTLLGQHGIGLEGGGVFSTGKESHAHFLVEDGPRARQVLVNAGFDVRDVRRPLRRKLLSSGQVNWVKLRSAWRKMALIFARSTAITATGWC